MSQASFWRSWAELLHKDLCNHPQTVFLGMMLLLFFTKCTTKWQVPRQQGRRTSPSSCWDGAFFSFFTHTDSFLPSFLLLPSSPSWMPDIAAVMPSAPLISPIVSQRGAVTTQPPTIAASASHPHHHVARYCYKSSLEPVDVNICGEVDCGHYLWT